MYNWLLLASLLLFTNRNVYLIFNSNITVPTHNSISKLTQENNHPVSEGTRDFLASLVDNMREGGASNMGVMSLLNKPVICKNRAAIVHMLMCCFGGTGESNIWGWVENCECLVAAFVYNDWL